MLYAIASTEGPGSVFDEIAGSPLPTKVARLFGSRELATQYLPNENHAQIVEVDDALAWLVAAEQQGATHIVEIQDQHPAPEPTNIKDRIGELRASMTINCDPSELTVRTPKKL